MRITSARREVTSTTSFIYQENLILRDEVKRLREENAQLKKVLDVKIPTCSN